MPNNMDELDLPIIEELEEDFESESFDSELAIDDEIETEEIGGSNTNVFSLSPKIILAAANVIRPDSTIMNIVATVGGGAVTMTSNPTIADGINGQILILRGSHATDTITLTDGNGMQLNGDITLGLNDTITLYYDALIANDWIEITRSDNLGLLTSGTYTPTLSNTTNVSASTPRLSQYLRVGNTVTVSGQLDLTPAGAGALLLGISLPIASAFTTAFQLGGVASPITIENVPAGIEADAPNDRASLKFIASATDARTLTFTFTYQVI